MTEQDKRDLDMLRQNHKGEWCWLTGKVFCQEGWCSECAIYQDYLADLKRVGVK